MFRLLVALVTVLLSPLICHAFLGRTGAVLSGDTFILNENGRNYTIRLYGIDAPDEGQIGSQPSSDYLKATLRATESRVTVLPVGGKKDNNGRMPSVVYKDGVCVNEQMVREGQAWYYSPGCLIDDCPRWKEAEAEARSRRKGIWAIPGAEEPWLYRAKQPSMHSKSEEGYIEGVYYKSVNNEVVTKDPNEADLFPVVQMIQPRFNFGPEEKMSRPNLHRVARSKDWTTYQEDKYDTTVQPSTVVQPPPAVPPSPIVNGTNGDVFSRDPGSGSLTNTRDGSVAVPAGPNGYIDTRTGKFMPSF